MRRCMAWAPVVVGLSLLGCKKPAKAEVISFEENTPTYGRATMTFRLQTTPGARIEYLDQSTYASASGDAKVVFPLDKVTSKPGGKGLIYLTLIPPSEAKKVKKSSGPFLFDWPAAVTVTGDSVSCGSRRCRGKLDSSSSRLELEVDPGTVVEIDGQTLPSGGPKLTTTLDFSKRARSAPTSILGDGRSKYKFEVPITITFADKTKLEGKLPRDGRALGFVNTQLGTIAKGPVRFAGETAGPSANRSLVVYSILGSKVLGTAATIGDLDLVSSEKTTIRSLSCGSYRSRKTGNVVGMSRLLHDEEVSVYERRTGALVATKRFVSRTPACPDVVRPGASIDGYVDSSAVEAWLATFLK